MQWMFCIWAGRSGNHDFLQPSHHNMRDADRLKKGNTEIQSWSNFLNHKTSTLTMHEQTPRIVLDAWHVMPLISVTCFYGKGGINVSLTEPCMFQLTRRFSRAHHIFVRSGTQFFKKKNSTRGDLKQLKWTFVSFCFVSWLQFEAFGKLSYCNWCNGWDQSAGWWRSAAQHVLLSYPEVTNKANKVTVKGLRLLY